MAPATATAADVTLVIPALNERENIAPLVAEIAAALDGKVDFEVLFVDDGSNDGTAEEIQRVMLQERRVRAIKHDRRCGKSAALLSGVRAARAPLIATLDADRQNDPADLPAILAAYRAAPTGTIGCVAGQRIRRRDTWLKRLSSRTANKVRRSLLRDDTRDSGCGFKLVPREVFLAMPQFEGMHRFLPALAKRQGLAIRLVDVQDRPRAAGSTKYGLWNRLWVGIGDMLAVWWLIRRYRRPQSVTEISP
ncbi:MAG TPA: glycosyltransferase family 2 protein [Kiloniellales bacterium]|nr:glycosyltransferase family 2 protein [Kiloniellales bacterium]